MKKLEFDEMEKIEGGRFWGSDNYLEAVFDSSCPSGYAAQAWHDYYVMGVRTTHEAWEEPTCI